MDLDTWQQTASVEQSGGDYFSVFFCGLAPPRPSS
jgi:hypothetical protein